MTGLSPITKNNHKSPFGPAESLHSNRERANQNIRSVRRDTDSQIDILWSSQGYQSLSSFELIKDNKTLQKVLSQGKLLDKQTLKTNHTNSNNINKLNRINSQEIQNNQHKQYYLKTEDSPKITQSSNRNNNNINNKSLQIFNEILHTPNSHKQDSLSVKNSLAFNKKNNLSNTSKSPLQSARIVPTTPNSFYQLNHNNNSSYLSSESVTSRSLLSKEGLVLQNSSISNVNLEKNDSISFKEQYLKNKRNLEQNHVSQALEKKELSRLSVSSEKLKTIISNLQTFLQEAKGREGQCKLSRDSKVKEVQEEFLKKSTQMASLFEEVSEQYLEFEENLRLAEQAYDIDLETKALLKEDLNGRLIQRAELVAHKEDLEAISCQFQRQYEEEAQYLQEDVAISETVMKAQQQLREFSQELQLISSNKISLENDLQNKEYQLRIITEKLTDLSAAISKEKEIPSTQLCQAESRLRDISMEYALPDLELICCNYLRKIQGNCLSFEDAPGIQQIVIGIMCHKNGISLDDVLEYIQRQCLNGQSTKSKEQYIPAVEGLLRSLLSLEQINSKYCKVETELVAQYEQITKDIEVLNIEIKESNEKVNWLKAQIIQIESTLSSCEEKQEGLKDKYLELVVKNTQVVFSDYLGKSEEQFKSIALEHGEEQAQKLINSRKEEFERLMKEEQELRLMRMRSVYEETVTIESKITSNVNIVQDDILPKLKMILSDLPLARARLEQMKADIAAYQQAKIRLNQDMQLLDNCLQQKIEDINKSLSEEFAEAVLNTERIEVEIKGKIRQLKQEAVAIERTRQNIQLHIETESQIRQQLRIFEEQCVLQDVNNLWINKTIPLKQKSPQDFYQKRLSQQQPSQTGFILSNALKNHSKSALDGCNLNNSGFNSQQQQQQQQQQQFSRVSQLGYGQNNENVMENLHNIQVPCHQVKQHGSVSMWEGGSKNSNHNSNKQNQLTYSREQPSFKYSGYNPSGQVPLGDKYYLGIQDISSNEQLKFQTVPSSSYSYQSQSNNPFTGITGSVTQIAFPNASKIRNSKDFSDSQILNSSNILSRSITVSSSANHVEASQSKTSRSNLSPKNSYSSYAESIRLIPSNSGLNLQSQDSSRVYQKAIGASSPQKILQQFPLKIPMVKQITPGKGAVVTEQQTRKNSGSCGSSNILPSHRELKYNNNQLHSPSGKATNNLLTANSSIKNTSISHGGQPKLSSPESRQNWK